MKKYCLLAIVLLAGCGIFNRSTKSTANSYNSLNNKTESQSLLKLERVVQGQQMVMRRDSAEETYMMRFWPKGTFNFSADGKFSGQFDSIIVTGNRATRMARSSFSDSLVQDKSSLLTNQSSNAKTTSEIGSSEKVYKPDVKVVITLLIIAAITVYIAVKKLVKQI